MFLARTALATTSAWLHHPPAGLTQTLSRIESIHLPSRTERQSIVTPALFRKVRPWDSIWVNQLTSAPLANVAEKPVDGKKLKKKPVTKIKIMTRFFILTTIVCFKEIVLLNLKTTGCSLLS